MAKVFYMNFEKDHKGALDKVGGLPTHTPPYFPISPCTGKELGFLFQIYCGEKLPLQDALCIQVYQSIDIDSGDDGEPVIVKVPLDAPLNDGDKGVIHPEIRNYDISWEEGAEPDFLPETMEYSSENMKMMQSKLGGAVPTDFNEGKFLGWVSEYPVYFNFGSLLCILLKDDGELELIIT